MILIWSRWGIVVAALAVLGGLTGYLLELAFQAGGIVVDPGQASALFIGIGIAIGGGYTWIFERYVLTRHLDKPQLYSRMVPLDQPQTLADGTVQTHVRTTFQSTPRSTLFFIPFKYWWIILVAIGGIVAIIGVVALVA